jgi:hypothetical protein
MSIINNSPTDADFFLAEVAEKHANKQFIVDLFDAGEVFGGGIATLEIFQPGDLPVPCQFRVDGGPLQDPQTNGRCDIRTANDGPLYNGQELTIEIDIPSTYSCAGGGTDCWWTLYYDFPPGAQVQDRTTWSARILGDPVHLTE